MQTPKRAQGEVHLLLDVHTDAGALQSPPHLLCNAQEPALIARSVSYAQHSSLMFKLMLLRRSVGPICSAILQ